MPMIGQRCGFMLLKRSVSRNYIDAAVHPKREISTKFQQVSSVDMILQLRRGQKNVDVRKIQSATEINLTTIQDETRELMAMWPVVVRDLTDGSQYSNMPEVYKWIAKVLEYNVAKGKKLPAIALINAYKQLVPPDSLTEENIRLACILGWCIELKQGFAVLADDICDGGTIRRGQTSWHLHTGHGVAAINDGLLLYKASNELLRIHFQHKDCYINMLKFFHEMELKTIMGQSLDILLTMRGETSKLDLFTIDRYDVLCNYKTGYIFMVPISIAMYFAGLSDPGMHREVMAISKKLSRFCQIQNDYFDCYGDQASTGKDESDIQEGKCTWLVVVALERATAEQKKILEECYGSKEPEKVAAVKQLYNDIDLPSIYAKYKKESYDLLTNHIQELPPELPQNLFLSIRDNGFHTSS